VGFMIIFNFFHPERALFNFTPMWPGWACILAVGGGYLLVSLLFWVMDLQDEVLRLKEKLWQEHRR
jgi:hypothetical protein